MLDILKDTNFTRIPAVDGSKPSSLFRKIDTISPGANGCLCSHILALQQFLNDGYEWCIVMEDDVSNTYSDFWEPQHVDLINNGSSDFDILQLVVIGNYNNRHMIPVVRQHDFWSAAAYLINRPTAQRIVDNFLCGDGIVDLTKSKYKEPCADNEIYRWGTTMSLPMFSYDVHIDNTSNVNQREITAERRKYITYKRNILRAWSAL